MVTTPTVWKPEYGLNLFTDAPQFDPAIVDIGGGQFVSVWTDYNVSVVDTGGINIVGQIFDAEGNSFGGPFQVNETAGTGLQENPAVASRPGGGFVVVYESAFTTPSPTTQRQEIIVDTFDADGGHISGAKIQADDGDKVWNPSVAMRSDGSYLVTYTRERDSDHTFDVVARRVSASGTIGDEVTIFNSGATAKHAAEAAVLSNGNYVIGYEVFVDADDSDVQFKIVGQTGAVPNGGGSGFQVSLAGAKETDVQLAALKGGGFAIVWRSSNGGPGDIEYAVYNNNGGAVKVLGGISGGLHGQHDDGRRAIIAGCDRP